MVHIEPNPRDPAVAWRVRDALAAHPLLGGATAHIVIGAGRDSITLEGWTLDEAVHALAIRLARRAAGRRTLRIELIHGLARVDACPQDDANGTLTRRLRDENAQYTLR